MNCKNLIKNAYKYYDEKTELYENIKDATYVENIFDSDLKESKIKFYINKKLILEANYEMMGTYYSKDNLFIWAWANINNKKNMTYISKDILKYGLDIILDDSSDNTDEFNLNSFLKTLLINSRININNQVELDIITYISFYLSKKDWITSIQNTKNSNNYIFVFLYNVKTY